MNSPIAAAVRALGKPGKRLELADLVPALLDDGLLAADDARQVLRYAGLSTSGQHALIALAQRNLKSAATGKPLELDTLCIWLAARVGLTYRHIDPLKVDLARVADVMSSQYAERFAILPLEVRGSEVTIATSEPFVVDWVEELGALLHKSINRVLVNPLELKRYSVEFYSLAKSVRQATRKGLDHERNNFEQLVDLGRSGRSFDANDAHIVTIVDWLWQYAFEQRASDIHVEPRRHLGNIRFRIDGVLHQVYQVPSAVLSAMTSRIKLLGRMDVVEKRRPQDGRIKTRTSEGKEIELRLSTLPTAFGEKLVMRIFDPEVLMRDFQELGFPSDDIARWNAMTTRPNGIILVTGPTGSGKTTTLYTTLKHLATDEVNVCTVEDPIEMIEPAFNQMQVQPAIELNFAEGVRALMRQDPDIIMVGEIRDLATAEMAIQAALTGHLVLSTLHTQDAAGALTRLLDLGAPEYLLNATLIGVVAQRLVRTLCPHCKQESAPLTDEQWQELVAPFRANKPARSWRAVGCLECRMTGYQGRSGIYELLVIDDELRGLISRHADLQELRRVAMRAGLRPLRLAGAQKVAAGLTTIEEVLRSAPPMTG